MQSCYIFSHNDRSQCVEGLEQMHRAAQETLVPIQGKSISNEC